MSSPHCVAVFLEGHEDPALVEPLGAVNQEAGRQQGLAGRATADQRRATEGQAPIGNLIETLDAGGSFANSVRSAYARAAANALSVGREHRYKRHLRTLFATLP